MYTKYMQHNHDLCWIRIQHSILNCIAFNANKLQVIRDQKARYVLQHQQHHQHWASIHITLQTYIHIYTNCKLAYYLKQIIKSTLDTKIIFLWIAAAHTFVSTHFWSNAYDRFDGQCGHHMIVCKCVCMCAYSLDTHFIQSYASFIKQLIIIINNVIIKHMNI